MVCVQSNYKRCRLGGGILSLKFPPLLPQTWSLHTPLKTPQVLTFGAGGTWLLEAAAWPTVVSHPGAQHAPDPIPGEGHKAFTMSSSNQPYHTFHKLVLGLRKAERV